MINFFKSFLFPAPPSIYASKYWVGVFTKYREEYDQYRQYQIKKEK